MSEIRGEKWVRLENAIIARLETHGTRFEIIVDPKLAWELKEGKDVDIREVLKGYIVFEDLKHGKRASEEKLREAFGTDDIFEISKIIIKKGQLQLTAEQRRKMIEEKKKRIIDLVSKYCINPQTGLPHPPARIEKALEEAKAAIDPFKDPETQLKDIVKALQPIIPIRMEMVTLKIRVPAVYTGKVYGLIVNTGNLLEERWLADGSLEAQIELPAGVKVDFLEKINKITKGQTRVEVVKKF
ncbi:MAG: ribosome assembly factor SBDS [Candidatus Baldrarchaeota archaeon]|nr:ribosome assembly factor SBDS [Candidatus Baldrarchaeota archaeon]